MKYCKKCKHIYNDVDQNCSACSKALEEITDENTPVYLISASGFELQRVKAALEDSGIPCDGARRKKSQSAEAVTGYDTSETDILVPFSAYEKAYDVCVGIGAIKEDGEQILDDESQGADDEKSATLDEQFEEMSGVKRTTFRIISAILFFLLIALVVYGTDAITGFIKGLL